MATVAVVAARDGAPTGFVDISNGVDFALEIGDTPLVHAAVSGDVREVEALLDRGEDVNALGSNGWTPLMGAAETGKTEVVIYLIACGAEVNVADEIGSTPLMAAASAGDLEAAECLVANGAVVQAANKRGWTPLHIAARWGRVKVVRFLIECQADVNARTELGWTPLGVAAIWSEVEVVRCLLDSGADASIPNNNGSTPLVEAARSGNLETVAELMSRGADVNAQSALGWTPLIRAASAGQIEVGKYLVQHEADVNARDRDGRTPLLAAAAWGDIGLIRFLVTNGAEVNASNADGATPLLEAAEAGHAEIVHFLLGQSAAVNAANQAGSTALLLAARNGHVEVVRHLVARGADVNAANREGRTPMYQATKYGHREIRRILMRRIRFERAAESSDAGLQGTTRSFSWYIAPVEIELLNDVRTGNIGGDYRAKWLDADVVVKLFVPDGSRRFMDEAGRWQQLRHPNVMKLYGACDAVIQIFVAEYASNGTVLEHLSKSEPDRRTPWKFLYEAALGLEYLHGHNILHGNLRCDNILVGNDGLAKLADFRLSASTASQAFGSMRWQAPECLRGEAPSPASDVYSLGLCLVEAVTRAVPWPTTIDEDVKCRKTDWRPKTPRDRNHAPPGLHGEKEELMISMCSFNPHERASIASVVFKLGVFAAEEAPKTSVPNSLADTKGQIGKTARLWSSTADMIRGMNDTAWEQAFRMLETLQERIESSKHRSALLICFHELLVGFHNAVKTSAEQTRIQRIASTRSTFGSLQAIMRRIANLSAELGSPNGLEEAQWSELRQAGIAQFVSELSSGEEPLHALQTEEDRAVFLAFMRAEIQTRGSSYTLGQLNMMRMVCGDIVKLVTSEAAATTIPAWFVPWYELKVDKWSCLGEGGFGSVHRAKWMDCDVVVKELNMTGSRSSSAPSFASTASTTASDPVAGDERVVDLRSFKHEADIWFDLNHPHIVRLFGACHIKRRFFVCEYASKGTLTSHLRAHPEDIWTKLHEAALGVQYLHERGIVHGDLKGNNVVVGSDGKAKVTDFGLSHPAVQGLDASAQTTGAWQWVAPECILGGRPSFASDVYAFGMCVVEAMRVVEASAAPYPWGDLDNLAVKVHVTRNRSLPARPSACTDDQWNLVQRMCKFNPEERIKIVTVVDELAKIAGIAPTDEPRDTSGEDVPRAVSTMPQCLRQQQGAQDDADRVVLCNIYERLWDRLGRVHAQVQEQVRQGEDPSCLDDLLAFSVRARDATLALSKRPRGLTSFTKTALRGYALHRRLDKVIAANFVVLADSDVVEEANRASPSRPPVEREVNDGSNRADAQSISPRSIVANAP